MITDGREGQGINGEDAAVLRKFNPFRQAAALSEAEADGIAIRIHDQILKVNLILSAINSRTGFELKAERTLHAWLQRHPPGRISHVVHRQRQRRAHLPAAIAVAKGKVELTLVIDVWP